MPRAFSILSFNKQWVNGTMLTYYCYQLGDGVPVAWYGSPVDVAQVKLAFDEWFTLGIGIQFREVTSADQASVRIAFDQTDGSWSYVGRDILSIRDPLERTMNFGWALNTPHGYDTALHEIGHSIGLEHEHQNPHAGIIWDEMKVKQYFRASPNNWDDATIEQNILRKIATNSIRGGSWDPNSIMEYPFAAGLIQEPVQYVTQALQPPGGLSSEDKLWLRATYPLGNNPVISESEKLAQLKVGLSQLLLLDKGQTRLFEFKCPRTRNYDIATFGTSDTVMVVFEVTPKGNVQIAGDDDSGEDRNAKVKIRLVQGRTYQIGLRLYFSDSVAETAVMVW